MTVVDPDQGLGYLMAADAILVAHILFVAFVVLGLVVILVGRFLDWRFVRNWWFRVAHLAAIALVVVQSWLGVICPLTTWEMALRKRADVATYEGEFIAHWLQELLYYSAEPWMFIAAYSVFGLLVVISWAWIVPDRRK